MAEHEDEYTESGFGEHRVTLDDIGSMNETPTAPDYSKVTLEGDEIPEELRGKSLSDALKELSGLKNALKISEDARIALKNSQEALETRQQTPSPTPPPSPAPEPELTEDQLKELFESDPFKFHQYQAQQLEKRLLGTVQRSVQPVVGSAADFAIRESRSRFPDEWKAFGKEIETMISQLPDRSALANPGAMDQLMNYARGTHWQKFQEYLNSKNGGTLDEARDSLARETPQDFSRAPKQPSSPTPSRRQIQLDDVQKQIADAMGISHADYAKNITADDLRRMKHGR